MDVGEEQIAGLTHHADLVLDVQCELEVVAPATTLVAVVRQYRIIEEDPESVEIRP